MNSLIEYRRRQAEAWLRRNAREINRRRWEQKDKEA
jgi:hypothetical protein